MTRYELPMKKKNLKENSQDFYIDFCRQLTENFRVILATLTPESKLSKLTPVLSYIGSKNRRDV